MNCAWMWQQGCAYDSTATAAWVQAVGSIIAIFAAGAFIALERRADARRRLSALAGVLELGLGLIDDAHVRTRKPYGADFMGYLTTFDRAHFDRAADLLDRVPLHEMPSADMAVAVHNARILLKGAADSLQKKAAVVHNLPDGLQVDLSAELKRVAEIRRAIEAAWQKVGGH